MIVIEIKPNPGPQVKALQSTAKVVLLGGAKGGGKSFALRLAPCYYLDNPDYHAVIFRRSLPQVKKPGGMWDKSYQLYSAMGGYPRVSELKWIFPSGASVQFGHLQNPTSWQDWQGTESAFFGFDQLEEFTQEHFLKILGCMRTTSGCPTQLMATMNPDANSWLREFVSPWIAKDGYVDLDLNGKTFYFTVENSQITWVDADWRDANGQPPVSVVYISADIWDNPALLKADPAYLSSLMTQSLVDRERYLGIRGRGGNWNSKAEAGKVFQEQWFQRTQLVSYQHGDQLVRFWDFAASLATARRSDFTVGVLLLKRGDRYFVLDMVRLRLPPTQANTLVLNTARADGNRCQVRWQVEPGASGVRDSANLQTLLAGFDARGVTELRDKVSRAMPSSAGFESGTIQLCYGEWNQVFINELVNFPDGDHDDIVDAVTGSYNCLTGFKTGVSNFTY
jgi:predicted phage terminase large subunit-like protein